MDGGGQPGRGSGSIESTVELVQRYRAGEPHALEVLFERYVPALRRYAHGRLPRYTRDMLDTDDMIQDTLIRTMGAIERFEPRGNGALLGYMRRALNNRIVDEVRKAGRRPGLEEVGSGEATPDPSPLEETIGLEAWRRYEEALAELPEADRHAVAARMEFGLDYEVIAQELGKPTRDAARMACNRALLRLAERMGHGG